MKIGLQNHEPKYIYSHKSKEKRRNHRKFQIAIKTIRKASKQFNN